MKKETLKQLVEEYDISWADSLNLDMTMIYGIIADNMDIWLCQGYLESFGFIMNEEFIADDKWEEYERKCVELCVSEICYRLHYWAENDMALDRDEYEEFRGEHTDKSCIEAVINHICECINEDDLLPDSPVREYTKAGWIVSEYLKPEFYGISEEISQKLIDGGICTSWYR